MASRTDVPRTEDEVRAWKKCMAKDGAPNLCAWVRATLNEACARQGIKVVDSLDGEEDE